jgi:hypothetical protein
MCSGDAQTGYTIPPAPCEYAIAIGMPRTTPGLRHTAYIYMCRCGYSLGGYICKCRCGVGLRWLHLQMQMWVVASRATSAHVRFRSVAHERRVPGDPCSKDHLTGSWTSRVPSLISLSCTMRLRVTRVVRVIHKVIRGIFCRCGVGPRWLHLQMQMWVIAGRATSAHVGVRSVAHMRRVPDAPCPKDLLTGSWAPRVPSPSRFRAHTHKARCIQ